MEEAPPSPPSPPSPPCSAPTAPLSVSQLVRLHRRERLLVRPIHWTDRHLELLGCSFGDPSRAPPKTTPVLFGRRGSGYLRYAFKHREWRVQFRETALLDVLATAGPFADRFGASFLTLPSLLRLTNDIDRQNIRFAFNRRHVQTLRCTIFLPKIQQEPDPWPPLLLT
ncbi:hypothetical protein HRG_003733 [Hirsutella rhossiliensis]|uniref:Uncharacterized protein n=1 Tax=Hirsutella rhossiliensis TaxID=111463 RepID=A0A9P8N2H3_9HYPO|nr:uncharacterized protein HRG_03733 [Hirsutella rhossiliensis]KAH0965717.1 hypothetical protein HRG_03733 [Hirsutella rhossiliensis]